MPGVPGRIVGWLTLVLTAIAWPASAQNERLRPYVCSARYGQPPTSPVAFLYRSGVFQSGAEMKAIADGWQEYLRKTLTSQASGLTVPSCQPINADPAAQALALEMIDRQASEEGRSVVPLRWQYTDEQPTDTGTARAPGPSGWYCYTDTAQSPIYFSDVFEGDDSSAATRTAAAFLGFLRQRYAYANAASDAVTCAASPSVPDGQVSKAQWQSGWREARRQIVETGWRLIDGAGR